VFFAGLVTIFMKLLQNFSFATATAEKRSFAGLQSAPVGRKTARASAKATGFMDRHSL
jgi:hypothetical protein